MSSTYNIAYYLKYRPQSLSEIIGQENVKKTLNFSFQENRLAHAYLFTGPRGTGKTSTARILAKMVNCESQSSDPCNKCSSCISITDGSNLDLIEIDAASNRGIEDIRSLRDKIKLSPTTAKKKVYIIDEVHMLTTEAFNALLKTLEEPPSHALFILATTEAGKIPQTILSRVQRLDFKLATRSELLQALQKIVMAEKINIDDGGLKLLIKKSDGSFRDGVKLLDQVSSLEGRITAEVLEKFLKSTNFETILHILEVFEKKDTQTGLKLITKEIDGGIDIKELILALMDAFRNMVYIKNGLADELVKEKFSLDFYHSLIKVSENLTNQDLVKNLDILQKAYQNLKTTAISSLPLELAVVEICGEESSQTAPSIIYPPLSNSDSTDIQKLREKWTYVCETIRPYNFSLEALLRSTNITQCTQTAVIMEVPYSFHQRILESPKNRDILESILSEILGRQIKISTMLGNRPESKEDVANIEVAADDDIIRAAAEIFSTDSIN
ncbi:DNA polymerase III subunit gamma/tau [Candidatus Daviesbacteria bacterium]|nr:DNA polymerase III subunit gamma/tau [Candidatus Daviesbacteria bacterium]